jgi:hypothetical protein
MAESGTMLSDLENAPPSDGDLVNSIYSDLGMPSGQNPLVPQMAPQPPMGVRAPQMVNQQGPLPPMMGKATDPAVPTAHMIGREHPTAADFDRMMSSHGPMPYNGGPGASMGYAPANANMPLHTMQGPTIPYEPPKKNWQGQWIDELKQPLLVAIVIFVMTLPAIHLVVNHYIPSLLHSGGSFTPVGQLARALAGGLLYWVLMRVIAPLLSV